MRNPLRLAVLMPALLLFAAPLAGADEPKAESAQDAAESEPAAEAKPAEKREFTPPSGFIKRTRGQYVVYCRREEPKGTRFPKEVCYDEAGIREMLQAQREDHQKVEAMRKVQTITIR
jgi:hypothetical protein